MRTHPFRRGALLALLVVSSGTAGAADPESCRDVTFSDVGWTDITATTAATTVILEAIGYDTDIKVLSVPVTYTSLAEGDIDIFLGNWMPTMEGDIAPYRDAGTVDTVRANLEGAKYTLAVNKAAADLGIADFSDIAANADALAIFDILLDQTAVGCGLAVLIELLHIQPQALGNF